MVPVVWLIESPVGRPVAVHVNVWPVWESVAELVSGVIAVPETLDWLPGLVTETVLVTVQVNEVEPAKPALSVALTVGVYVPGVVGVPVMVPVELAIESPVGRPVAV